MQLLGIIFIVIFILSLWFYSRIKGLKFTTWLIPSAGVKKVIFYIALLWLLYLVIDENVGYKDEMFWFIPSAIVLVFVVEFCLRRLKR